MAILFAECNVFYPMFCLSHVRLWAQSYLQGRFVIPGMYYQPPILAVGTDIHYG